MEYEILYLIGESQENNLVTIKKEVEGIIIKQGGKFLEEEWIEQRKLAYPIQHEKRGTYIARRFVLPDKDQRFKDKIKKDFIGNITRKLNLQDNILRFIIVKAEELPPLENKEIAEIKPAKDKKENLKNNKEESKIEKKKTDSKTKKTETTKLKKEDKIEKKEVDKNKETKAEVKKDILEEKDKMSSQNTENKKKEDSTLESDKGDDIDKKLEEILNI